MVTSGPEFVTVLDHPLLLRAAATIMQRHWAGEYPAFFPVFGSLTINEIQCFASQKNLIVYMPTTFAAAAAGNKPGIVHICMENKNICRAAVWIPCDTPGAYSNWREMLTREFRMASATVESAPSLPAQMQPPFTPLTALRIAIRNNVPQGMTSLHEVCDWLVEDWTTDVMQIMAYRMTHNHYLATPENARTMNQIKDSVNVQMAVCKLCHTFNMILSGIATNPALCEKAVQYFQQFVPLCIGGTPVTFVVATGQETHHLQIVVCDSKVGHCVWNMRSLRHFVYMTIGAFFSVVCGDTETPMLPLDGEWGTCLVVDTEAAYTTGSPTHSLMQEIGVAEFLVPAGMLSNGADISTLSKIINWSESDVQNANVRRGIAGQNGRSGWNSLRAHGNGSACNIESAIQTLCMQMCRPRVQKIIGHNFAHDWRIIRHACLLDTAARNMPVALRGMFLPDLPPICVCTMTAAQRLSAGNRLIASIPIKSHKLIDLYNAIVRRNEIPPVTQLHKALPDAHLAKGVYRELISLSDQSADFVFRDGLGNAVDRAGIPQTSALFGCFVCSDPDHFATSCTTQKVQ